MDANFFLAVCCVALAVAVAVLSFLLFRHRTGHKAKQSGIRPDLPLTCGYENQLVPKDPAGKFFRDVSSLDESLRLWDNLIVLMEEKKLYLEPDIKIARVAEILHTSDTHLSKIIKARTGNNFRHFIHSYRVKEAMRLFSLNPTLTSSELMTMVGFNSQTTFNSAFSRCTGYTPAEWCREYQRKNGEEYKRPKR